MRCQTILQDSSHDIAFDALQGGPSAAVPDAPMGTAETLFRRWLDLSELDRRAFLALVGEIQASSDLVETSTMHLSEQFQALALGAQAQMGQVDAIVAIANSLEINGETLPLRTAMESVEQVLRRFIDTIVTMSKNAMRMVYALDDVVRDVEDAGQCVKRIEMINTQTRYLALNASIEANRSGAAGAPFRVIATELKDLSQSIDLISAEVQQRIEAITQGVNSGHKVLQTIATLDLTEHIKAKERLDSLVTGIISQNTNFTDVLATAAVNSANIARTVAGLTTSMQFQDRTKQHLDHVVAVLGVLGDATRSVQDATHAAYPGHFEAGIVDRAWLNRIIEGQTLGALKQRVMARLLAENADDAIEVSQDSHAEADAGEIELF